MSQRKIIAPFLAGALLLSAASYAATSDVADAVMNRDDAAVRALLTKKVDVNAPQADGATALHWAVYHEDVALVDRLLAAGANVMAPNREGATPFYLACVSGNAEIMGKLLKRGADVNGTFLGHGETPLMIAARTGRPEAVKLLVEAGAKVEVKETMRQTTALMWAAEQGHAEVVKLLVANGADINATSTVEEAKKRRGVVYTQGEDQHTGGVTALVLAARQGNLEAVKALAEAGADLNKTSGDGSSAMVVAVQNGHYDIARYLVEKGADVNLANEKGWSPLYLAVKHRNLETGTIPVPNQNQSTDFIKLLLDQPKIDVNTRVKFNTEIRNGQRATWLEEAGATPFLRAALCGDVEVMRWLLAKGADPKIATTDGTTPLMAASGVGFSEGFIHDRSVAETLDAIKLILQLGTDINAQNAGGLTALHGAAHKSGIEAIKLLVENGASLTILSKPAAKFGNSKEGLLPLDWAQGVPVGVQSAIYHAEAVDYLTKMMNERGIPIPNRNRTLGGNAAVANGTK
jgi:ankyrin repeat protein